jgi:hypothetical protein
MCPFSSFIGLLHFLQVTQILLRNSRKTERAATSSFTRLLVRAAPFALRMDSNRSMNHPHKPTPVEKIELPEDPRKEWSAEDIEIEGRKPDLEETEEDEIDL